jgi:hypothetical protein
MSSVKTGGIPGASASEVGSFGLWTSIQLPATRKPSICRTGRARLGGEDSPMKRSLLVLFSAVFIMQPAYSQTAPAPDAKAMQDLQDLLERMPDAGMLGLEFAQEHLLDYDRKRSKIGFMKYCEQKQYLDSETAKNAAQLYTTVVDLMFHAEGASHRAHDRGSGDEAERQGGIGILYFKNWGGYFVRLGEDSQNGKSLDSYATMNGTTPAAICKEWASEASVFKPFLAIKGESGKMRKEVRDKVWPGEETVPSAPAGK